MDITLNINKLIDALCAANCTNGELTAEVEFLTKENINLTNKIRTLHDELSALKEEHKQTESLYKWCSSEADKYKALYESVTK